MMSQNYNFWQVIHIYMHCPEYYAITRKHGVQTQMKICLVGAGSTIFSRNILGDVLLIKDSVPDLEIALYDIDENSAQAVSANCKPPESLPSRRKGHYQGPSGIEQRREALTGSHFVINVIQVGGYRPSTLADFEIPRKYGLRQTIADTLGIGVFFGLFEPFRWYWILPRDGRTVSRGMVP